VLARRVRQVAVAEVRQRVHHRHRLRQAQRDQCDEDGEFSLPENQGRNS
jgi:hypothetical protein